MIRSLKNKIKKIIFPFLLYHREDGHLYYGEYKGSFNFWRLFFWNLIHPARLYNRFQFGQLFKFRSKKIKNFKKKLNSQLQNNIDSEYDNFQLCSKFKEFLECGGVVIESYFSENKIQKFLEKHKTEIDNIKKIRTTEHNIVNQEELKITQELVEFWLDNKLMTFISSFIDREVLARNYPYIQYHSVVEKVSSKLRYEKKTTKSEGADIWHVDTPFLCNFHVLLEDLTSEDSCMQYVPYTHKFPNMGNVYSDEVVKKMGTQPVLCVGKKGTVYMHQANTLHQFRPRPGTDRLQLHFEFTIGANILLNCYRISKCLSSGFDIDKLDNYKRNIIRGIFPKDIHKGYQIKKETFFPTKIKGI